MGRFVNRDPIEERGGVNLYAFVQNNSINMWDYLGMFDDQSEYFRREHGAPPIVTSPGGWQFRFEHTLPGVSVNFLSLLTASVQLKSYKRGFRGIPEINVAGYPFVTHNVVTTKTVMDIEVSAGPYSKTVAEVTHKGVTSVMTRPIGAPGYSDNDVSIKWLPGGGDSIKLGGAGKKGVDLDIATVTDPKLNSFTVVEITTPMSGFRLVLEKVSSDKLNNAKTSDYSFVIVDTKTGKIILVKKDSSSSSGSDSKGKKEKKSGPEDNGPAPEADMGESQKIRDENRG